jgi:lysozyme
MQNESLIRDLIRDEGIRFKAYKCTAGVWTIGVGHTAGVVEGDTCDEAQAFAWLDADIKDVERDLDARFPWWRDLSEPRQRALANIAFNIGIHRLVGFRRAMGALERGDFLEASVEFLNSKWATQVKNRALRVAELIKKG